jgi:hypothetical protein
VMTIQPSSGSAVQPSFLGTIKWSGGVTPPWTQALNAVDVWTFLTFDGSTYYGTLSMKDLK